MKRRRFIKRSATFGGLFFLRPHTLFSNTKSDASSWHIEQFQDKRLAHYSYAVVAGKEIVLIDPERDPQKYIHFAEQQQAKIVGVIETHPHADFTSSHLEIQRRLKAKVYTSNYSKTFYSSTPVRDGEIIALSNGVKLRAIHTPGHAPDHLAIVLHAEGTDKAVFSGDALLIGDVGRPDLRDYNNDVLNQRRRLAEQMYDTIHTKFNALADDVIVYPAHGAGSLCGKSIKDAPSSTIGIEKKSNPAFLQKDKPKFVDALLNDLPFVPKYFPFDVNANLHGLPDLAQSIAQIPRLELNYQPKADNLVIDSRPEDIFKSAYQPNAINLQRDGKFETWLGSIIGPDKRFYVSAENETALDELLLRIAKIGYETKVAGAYVYDKVNGDKWPSLNTAQFDPANGQYTIIDVRTDKEFKDEPVFANAIHIPLQELEQQINRIPTDKPIVVSCSSGYRSAAGSTIIKARLPQSEVFDLGKAVNQYKKDSHK